jgi:sec-independent protein translocase protein TatC
MIKKILLAPFRLLAWLLRPITRLIGRIARPVVHFFTEELQDTPITETLAKTVEHPMGLLEHLDALRKHLIRAVVVLGIATVISFVFAEKIFDFLTGPLEGGMGALVAIEVTEPIGTLMRISLLAGFALALPYISFELWLFIAPGLYGRTRLLSLIAIPVIVLFFLGGMAFAYYVMLPSAIPFLLNILGITTQIRPSSYVTFATGLMFWIGMAFEFPLIIFLMSSLGLVKASMLRDNWRLAVVIIAVVSALITPTVDPVNMSLVMGPLVALYFLSIGLAHLAQRKPVRK